MVHVQLLRVEGAQLAQLVDDFRDLVGGARDVLDPAIARLAPNPYPDDETASRAFISATRDELLDRRSLDAVIVGDRLSHLRARLDELSEEAAMAQHDVRIPLTEVDSWLRVLTALRLVIATRLGIDDEDADEPDDARFGVYHWLGYRLDNLVAAADEHL